MNRPGRPAVLLTTTLLLATAIPASAAPITIVDQQNLGGLDQFLANDFSQSFTPTLTGVDAIEVMAGAADMSVDVRLDLFDGDGTAGALLASTVPLTLSAAFGLAHFDFGSTISLTPGSVYTFQLVQLGGDGIVAQATGDTYAAGLLRDADGNPSFFGDMVFSEGLHPAVTPAVPEPTSMALFGLTALSLGVGFRRRREDGSASRV